MKYSIEIQNLVEQMNEIFCRDGELALNAFRRRLDKSTQTAVFMCLYESMTPEQQEIIWAELQEMAGGQKE
ncbi:hypothetical protein [Beggiatoa alba]|nr:hypothetical protein [Beggiatoa alba]